MRKKQIKIYLLLKTLFRRFINLPPFIKFYEGASSTLRQNFDWNNLRSNKRVSFEIAFNFYGTIALQLSEENRLS
jgi:hypothetical protein